MFRMDGNHSLNKKSKKEDTDDMSLGVGQAFFVDHRKIADTMTRIYARDDDMVVCIFPSTAHPPLTTV